MIIECGHTIETMCSSKPRRQECNFDCVRQLQCGHQCPLKCSERCTSDCRELVPLTKTSLCGHQLMIPCAEYQKSSVSLFITLVKRKNGKDYNCIPLFPFIY